LPFSGLLSLLLLICRIVHRPSVVAVGCIVTNRDGAGATRCIRGHRGIAIEDILGDFKSKVVTYLELEATPSGCAGRYQLYLPLV